MTPQRVVERLTSKVVAGPNECVISTYSTGSHGYSQIGWQEGGKRQVRLAHRVAYEAVYGPIPEGLTVDHTCRNRRCINWLHLRLLSNRVNGTLNGNAIKTHCKRGHEFTQANTILLRHRSGRLHRRCKACRDERNAARFR